MTRTLPRLPDHELPSTEAGEEPGFGSLDTARGRLPLEAMQVTGRIDGLLSQVVVRQTFVNTFDQPLEATYVFPLPDRAAVRDFRMEVADRLVQGELEERGKARARYDQAIAGGQRAAIAEEERPNVFTLRVGNLLPGERATIQLDLAGILPFSAGEVTFRFPLVVAPRYIPGTPLPGSSVGDGTALDTNAVPDASRISPPVLLPGFPSAVRLALSMDVYALEGDIAVDSLRSSLHTVVTEAGPGCHRVRLEPGERLDRDFILRFRLGSPEVTNSVRSSLSLHPDPDGTGETGTFALTLVPPLDHHEARRQRDVVFLLDRSGSMKGWKILSARRAVGRMIDTLGEQDRFALLAFDDVVLTPRGSAPELSSASDRNRFRALEFLAGIQARGGTEIAGPLWQAVELLRGARRGARTPLSARPARDAILVLVTDGQVGNEDQILGSLASKLEGIRVFTLGIDQAVNEAFLRRLAEIGRGACEVVESEQRLDEVMTMIHRLIATPVRTGVELDAHTFTIEPDTLVPAQAPDLFTGVPLLMLGRYRGRPSGGLVVRAREADGTPWSEQVEARVRENPAIVSAWARGQVRKLEDRYLVRSDGLEALERRIIETSLRFRVLCRFTAYVAVDHSERVSAGGELHRIIQPVEAPSGWGKDSEMTSAPLVCGYSGAPGILVEEYLDLASPPASVRGRTRGPRLAISPGFTGGSDSRSKRPAPPPAGMPPSPAEEFESFCFSEEIQSNSAGTPVPSPVPGLPERYVVLETIGEGALGSVIKALDRDRGRPVVVTVMPLSPESIQCFLEVVRSLSALRHPALAPILDSGLHGTTAHVVTEPPAGRPLSQLLHGRGPRPEDAALWVAEAAEAIQHAFELGVTLEPPGESELVVTPDGHAVIAELHPTQAGGTGLASGSGPLAYMAPERLGSGGVGDARGSVYGLGALLYRILAGRSPYRGQGDRLAALIAAGPPSPPRAVRKTVPKALEDICLKAMARAPEDRYATPGELAQALRGFLADQAAPRRGFWKKR